MREQNIGVRGGVRMAASVMAPQKGTRPSLMPGTVVWRGGETYVAELVERHGTEWMAGVVAAGDARRERARLRFIPVRELNWV